MKAGSDVSEVVQACKGFLSGKSGGAAGAVVHILVQATNTLTIHSLLTAIYRPNNDITTSLPNPDLLSISIIYHRCFDSSSRRL